jgi:hypothetical protein
MLGMIGNGSDNNTPTITVVPGANAYPVNLKPWDVSVEVNKSPKYPNGIKVIPAATQDDFKKILTAVPEAKAYIGDLSPQQEKVVVDSLRRNCSWYQDQNRVTGSENAKHK